MQLVESLTRPDTIDPDKWIIPAPFRRFYQSNHFGVKVKMLKFEDLQSVFIATLVETNNTYIVIDALDECDDLDSRTNILDFLFTISRNAPANTHILVISQKKADIETTVKESLLLNKDIVAIEDSMVDPDIKLHVCNWVTKIAKFNRWSQPIQNLIISEITRKSCGVFRWVECQLNALTSALRECDVEDALHQLPKDLDETYERILNQLQGTPYMQEAWMLFHWLSFSERSLTISEVTDAIAFRVQRQTGGMGTQRRISTANDAFQIHVRISK